MVKWILQVGVSAPDPWLKNSKRRRFADGGVDRSSDWIEMVRETPAAAAAAASANGGGPKEPPLVPVGKPTYSEAVHEALVEVAASSDSTRPYQGVYSMHSNSVVLFIFTQVTIETPPSLY